MDLFAAMFSIALVQSPAVEAPVQPQEREICRRVRSSTSRMDSRRVCKTAAEWAETARSSGGDLDAEGALDSLGENPRTGCIGGLPPGPGQQPGPKS